MQERRRGNPAEIFATVVRDQKAGRPRALFAACTASSLAIRAVLQKAGNNGVPALIESTAGQVNLAGGYTGLTPAAFRRQVDRMAVEIGLTDDRVILGGDHIGPHPWREEGADRAMPKAEALAAACIAAGYRKMHLDTAAPCRDDPRQADGTLPVETISRRAAALCRAAEAAARRAGAALPWYVIGSDVPAPGGALSEASTAVSDAGAVRDAVSAHRRAFLLAGLEDAWQRVFALVVHTGADFSPTDVHPYDSRRVQPLIDAVRRERRLVLEAHSTDFQTPEALSGMVADHFGILKVGPALTFALRETLFALAAIEKACFAERRDIETSRLPEVMDRLMLEDPRFWQAYYQGSATLQTHLRRHAFSDRIRYYWFQPRAIAAVERLMTNLRRHPPPVEIIAAHLPETAALVREGRLPLDPEHIVLERIGRIADTYARACRLTPDWFPAMPLDGR